jgi:hypothetical protein
VEGGPNLGVPQEEAEVELTDVAPLQAQAKEGRREKAGVGVTPRKRADESSSRMLPP